MTEKIISEFLCNVFFMSNLVSPIVAGAGLAFSLLFLMALANGATALVFGTSVEDAINQRMPNMGGM